MPKINQELNKEKKRSENSAPVKINKEIISRFNFEGLLLPISFVFIIRIIIQ